MKNFITPLIAVLFTGLVFWSCSDDSSSEATNKAPTCTITSPADDTVFTIGNNITINVEATDTDGTIAEVRFYFDENGIGSDTSFPYSYSISTSTYSEGTHTIKATTKDNDGSETSSEINITLTTINNLPAINSFTTSATSVQQGGTVNLICSASDADGDVLTYTWSKTGGTLSSTTGTSTTWIAPTVNGTYSITITVSDGIATVTDSKVISVTEEMIYVQGGSFLMGDHYADEGYWDEVPLHSVTLSNFYIGKCEVTNQYYCNMLNYAKGQGLITASTTTVSNNTGIAHELLDLDGSNCQIRYNGTDFVVDTGFENNPACEVTWYGSIFYCNMESRQAGYASAYNLNDWSCSWTTNGYRLPTEAEWEYSARGGIHNSDNLRYSGCNLEIDLTKYAWYCGNYTIGTSQPVGTKLPNQLGIYDMSGNVWEWCWDWYSSSYYQYCIDNSINSNPKGPSNGSYRIMRGGDWFYSNSDCRVADRCWNAPNYDFYDIGFRLARTP